MKRNLNLLGGLHNSQRVLLALTQAGLSREAAYAAVQRNAMEVWNGNGAFLNLLKADKEIGQFMANDELAALFDMGYHTKQVDTIFKRVFG
jgi:adenylosuccinate lyase